MIDDQLSIINYQLSIINYQLSIINYQLFSLPLHPTPYTDGGPTRRRLPYTLHPTPSQTPAPLHPAPYTLDDFASGDIRANNQTSRLENDLCVFRLILGDRCHI